MPDSSTMPPRSRDAVIIRRVAGLAERKGVSMTEISLAWLLTKVSAPVTGATKLHHIEGAVKAAELTLTQEEIAYLEEAYVPHRLSGVMAQNTPAAQRSSTSGARKSEDPGTLIAAEKENQRTGQIRSMIGIFLHNEKNMQHVSGGEPAAHVLYFSVLLSVSYFPASSENKDSFLSSFL